jgi:hypothetical protein
MADRLPTFLPRVAALVLVALGATAGLTYAAGSQLGSAPAVPTVATAPAAPVIVPDVRNQAFTFAKGALEEAGFAWQVTGSVHGYPSNVVVSQSPAPGTRLVDAGAPRITLTLRQGSYGQSGEPADASPYDATAPQPADLSGNPIGPAAPAEPVSQTVLPTAAKQPARAKAKTASPATPAATPVAPATPAPAAKHAAAKPAAAKPAAAWPQTRPAAFDVPGARKEPLDEMPLPDRARALSKWLEAHPTRSSAAAKHWLYQNEWIVTGAKLGWWRGAEALKTLIAVDRRAQALWGIGAKSAGVAEQALSTVQTRAKS